MAAVNNCFICEQSLESDIIEVKEKGVKTFQESSEKRKDGKLHFLKGRKSVSVHDACRKSYNNEKLIAAFLRRGGSATVKLRSTAPAFQFHKQCFLCAEEITEDFLKKQKKTRLADREIVYDVRKISVKNTVLEIVANRYDDWAREIAERLHQVVDLVAVKAKYHLSCMKKIHAPSKMSRKRGGHPSSDIDEAMQFIYSYLEENSEECQFCLDNLMKEIKCEYRPTVKTVKARLLQKYGNDIIIACTANKSSIVCYRNTGYKVLTDAWYATKKLNEREERLRIVEAAATIVLEDIRTQVYETTYYSPSDKFLEDVQTVVPETLNAFLEKVIVSNKCGYLEKWRTKCTSIAHAVISAVRPRSFLSSLQIGLAAFLNKKYASRQLLEVLSTLGFCSTYKEAVRFEISAIMRPAISIDSQSFSQFVFDNADFNTQTLDGLNTFHAMGGINCLTPATAVAPDQKIKRLSRMPTAKVVGDFGFVPLMTFEKKRESGLKSIKIRNLEDIHPVSSLVLPSAPDLLWLYGKWADLPLIPGWNGFMEQASKDKSFTKTKVLCLPFVNAPPSDYDTIFTVLTSAAEKCKAVNQHTCFVTFDQPLYMKARDIVSTSAPESNLNNVVVRLGGFHLLMSFMGCIGYVMAGSGLKELLTTIYAPNSVEKMMTGHAYARALRAHILTQLALANIVLQMIDFTEEDRAAMTIILGDLDRSVILTADENSYYKAVAEKFAQQFVKLESYGSTAKLWVQYFRMVTLVKQFIEAERMGNWQLHLQTVQKMLPFFHACGHFFYAKSCHLYLQDMLTLHENMTPEEYEQFTSRGFFTIRRSDKFWSGIWTDMTIEQTLMRTMKSIGGLTHGRGIKDSVLTMWTLGMVFLHNVCDEIEKFCNVCFAATEQHVDMRSSRVIRDNQDVLKLIDWLSQHPPFPEMKELMSISSGVIGDEKINCHMAQELGTMSIFKIIGGDFDSVKFKRKDNVLPLASINTNLRIDNILTPINPLLIFRRMCIAKQSDEELKEYLGYELAPFPMSLFSEDGMRKTVKSAMYKLFSPCADNIELENSVYVIDGGYLLHRVVWNRSESFTSICENYIQYVRSRYYSNAIIVFDGYPEDTANRSTKSVERLRRSRKQCSADVIFDETMVPTISQDRFLGNENNKRRFISMLRTKLEHANFAVKQATEDADTLIVNTAIDVSSQFSSVIIIGEDVDLLVLLTALAPNPSNIYFIKPGRGRTLQQVYSTGSLQPEHVAKHVLFLHAFSGCDTTSALFKEGKIKFFNTFRKNPHLRDVVQIFNEKDAESNDVVAAGERFLLALYGFTGDEKMSLDMHRYKCFLKSATNSTFNLATLLPTSSAARQHLLRTYYQVQQWYGNVKNPVEWGWQRQDIGLVPVTTTKEPAPERLLQLISCKCKKGCRSACGCRKAGLKCSIICAHCNGLSCENVPEILNDEEDFAETDTLYDLYSASIFDATEGRTFREASLPAETVDENLSEPGPSRLSKRRKINEA